MKLHLKEFFTIDQAVKWKEKQRGKVIVEKILLVDLPPVIGLIISYQRK
jgi:hypothetical protein